MWTKWEYQCQELQVVLFLLFCFIFFFFSFNPNFKIIQTKGKKGVTSSVYIRWLIKEAGTSRIAQLSSCFNEHETALGRSDEHEKGIHH